MTTHPDITDLMRVASHTDGTLTLRSEQWKALADLVEAAREVALYPIETPYPDGPCLKRHDAKDLRDAIARLDGADR